MRWYELAENPQAISELYSDVPSLESVHLIEVSLHRDGTRMSLKVALPRFPDKPPARWKAQGYNTVQVQLDFWTLQTILINGWSTDNFVDIHILPDANKQIDLQIVSSHCSIEATAHDFRITLHKFNLASMAKRGEHK